MPEPTVFLHYSQAELDRNFDQRNWISNALELIARQSQEAEAARAALAHQPGVPYGDHPDETLDIFPGQPGGPVLIFVHGGAWKNFSKGDFSFVANGYASAGIHTVVPDFTNLPASTLPQTIAQVRAAIAWTCRNIARYGGNPARVFVAGQSSGAHLAASALLTDWRDHDLPTDAVKGAILVSGSYDLRPVVLSARGDYVKLTAAEVLACSPMFQAERLCCDVLLAYADGDTDEFRRQSQEFARQLQTNGRLRRLFVAERTNHFEITLTMADPASALRRAIVERIAAG